MLMKKAYKKPVLVAKNSEVGNYLGCCPRNKNGTTNTHNSQ
jgi:hypothetical protein